MTTANNRKGFQPGKSGNPTGRPKVTPELLHVREMAKQYTAEAIAALVGALESENHSARITAANSLLDRAWGKPEQPITGRDGNAIEIVTKESRDAATAAFQRANG